MQGAQTRTTTCKLAIRFTQSLNEYLLWQMPQLLLMYRNCCVKHPFTLWFLFVYFLHDQPVICHPNFNFDYYARLGGCGWSNPFQLQDETTEMFKSNEHIVRGCVNTKEIDPRSKLVLQLQCFCDSTCIAYTFVEIADVA